MHTRTLRNPLAIQICRQPISVCENNVYVKLGIGISHTIVWGGRFTCRTSGALGGNLGCIRSGGHYYPANPSIQSILILTIIRDSDNYSEF